MIGVEIRGAEDVARRLTRGAQELDRGRERELNSAAVLLQKRIRERMSDGGGRHPFFGRTGGRGDTLAARSGSSRRRIILGRARTIAGVTVASVGSPDRHMRFLEEGGAVIGKPYLRIPLAAAQTPQGVDRFKGTSIRQIPGAFLLRTLGGRLFAVRSLSRRGAGGQATGRSRGLEWLYYLVRNVKVRGRHIFEASRRDVEPQVAALYRNLITRTVRTANG